ncbi:hypothetical protein ACFLT2_14310 [Acidobacteriota bacterium]
MKTTKHGRMTMKKKIYVWKSAVLFIGLALLFTTVSFGSNTDPSENNLMWGTTKDSFSLVSNESAGLKWDCLVVDLTDTDNWAGRLGLARVSKIDSDLALRGEESGVTESRPKRGKLAFILRAGSASIMADGYSSSFSYGLGFFLPLSKRTGLEIILDRYSVPVSQDFEGMGTGKLQVTPFLLSGHWRFPLGRFVPYAAAGVGFYFIHFEADPQAEPSAAQDLVYADRFALHLGGGVDIQILRALDFFADLRYSIIKTWIQDRDAHHVEPADQDIFSLNTLVLALGLRYYF